MALETYNDYIRRFTSGFYSNDPVWGEIVSTSSLFGTTSIPYQRIGDFKTYPSLPSGVTGYIPACMNLTYHGAGSHAIIAKLIDLGTLNTAGPTFTDGNQMPTVTELGVSRQIPGTVMVEITAALNATPRNLSVTYVDQDNNTAETTSAVSLPASGVAGSMAALKLNGSDWGVLDITNATGSGGTTPSGTLKFWGVIPLGIVNMMQNVVDVCDFIGTGSNPMVFDAGESLVIMAGGTTAKNVMGSVFTIGDE